ncbi:MAG: putative metalloprotease CJM1_0395 family protein [Guyparkeria sp.]|uniref:putative metalloprotease CJM1_0395 family protein n=1 Tax=Guyparkeria sp. TaxID=2035736 RepID=UPI0039787F49
MTPIGASLSSLPPAPALMPGGVADVGSRAIGAGAGGGEPASGANATGNTRPSTPGQRASEGQVAPTPTPDRRATAEEQRALVELKARDQEVRAHENAHRAAGGDLVRGGSYDYQQGPDGKRYAIGGDVQIDTTPVPGDPQATAEKMARVIRAALAPAEPSPTDLAVAAQATAERNRALAEKGSTNDEPAENGNTSETNGVTGTYRRATEPSIAGATFDATA